MTGGPKSSLAGWMRGGLAAATLGLLLAPLLVGWLPQPSDPGLPVSLEKVSIATSAALAAGAAALSVLLGAALALALRFSRLHASALWATLLLIPFVAPATVWTLAQVACFGRGGLLERWLGDAWRPALVAADPQQYLATLLVLAQVHSPLAMLIVGQGIARLHLAGFEAARLLLAPRARALWMVRAMRQELLAAWLLAFALSIANFAVPHVMQCRLFIVDIYMRSANYLDQRGAMLAALPLVALSLAGAGSFAWLDRGVCPASASNETPWRGGRSLVVIALLALYLGLTILLPIGALAAECQSLTHFLAAVQAAVPETINTLLLACGAAGMAGLTAGIVAPWFVRQGHLSLELLALMPLGLPPLVIGLAYARSFHQPWPDFLAAVADSSLLAMLGLACRGLPFATRIMGQGARRQPRHWDEASRLSGMSLMQRWRWIVIPLGLNPAITAAIVVFVLAAGDVEVSHLLTVPGSGTLAMRLFTFLHFGPAHVTASLALWQLIVVLAPVLIFFLLTDRWLHVV